MEKNKNSSKQRRKWPAFVIDKDGKVIINEDKNFNEPNKFDTPIMPYSGDKVLEAPIFNRKIKETMETENKYYTPTLEELYVGFEYQEDDNNSNNWEAQVVGIDNIGDLDYFDDMIREGNIRVKHLDHQDIDELGWVAESRDTFIQGNFNLYKYKGKIEICVPDDYDHEEPHFYGTIKNKSELKKVMQMLNINTREDGE